MQQADVRRLKLEPGGCTDLYQVCGQLREYLNLCRIAYAQVRPAPSAAFHAGRDWRVLTEGKPLIVVWPAPDANMDGSRVVRVSGVSYADQLGLRRCQDLITVATRGELRPLMDALERYFGGN